MGDNGTIVVRSNDFRKPSFSKKDMVVLRFLFEIMTIINLQKKIPHDDQRKTFTSYTWLFAVGSLVGCV